MGISGKDGVFAEYVTLPAANLHLVPDQISDIAAVFTEPVAAALEIVEQVEISERDRVAVLGDGKLGILAAQVIQRKAGDLVSYGRAPEKAAFLKRLGIKAESGKSPRDSAFDIVVDCTGVKDGLQTALLAVKPRGTVVVKSTYSGGIELDFALPVIKEITIVGSRCGPFPRAIEALRDGMIQVEGMVSHTFPLSRGMEAMAAAADPQSLKVLIMNDLSFDDSGMSAV
jgi:threonine dehydrogenase-like Zn-dependent dehydrogenase